MKTKSIFSELYKVLAFVFFILFLVLLYFLSIKGHFASVRDREDAVERFLNISSKTIVRYVQQSDFVSIDSYLRFDELPSYVKKIELSTNGVLVIEKEIETSCSSSEKIAQKKLIVGTSDLGTLSFFYYNCDLFKSTVQDSFSYLFILLFSSSGLFFLVKYILRKTLDPISVLGDIAIGNEIATMDINSFPSELKPLFSILAIKQKAMNENSLNKEKLEISKQLAHDIRSPLAALDMSIKSLNHIEPSQKQLIRSAINRIHDIANNLVGKTDSLEKKERVESTLLTSVVQSIVSEKRTEYRNKNHIDIDFIISHSNYGLFSNVDSNELKRIISNLINNSVEAIDKKTGFIEIQLVSDNNLNQISIIDNGKGISAENLLTVFDDGISIDKEDGTGLGLFHAKTKIDEWSGEIKCKSIKGVSTEFMLRFPKSAPSEGFVESIEIKANSSIVIVDDDSSIHQVWKGRFESLGMSYDNLTVFSDPEVFSNWYKDNKKQDQFFLFDYEFLGHNLNGLDLFSLVDSKSRFLVTSRFEEEHIKESCLKKGISLVDKGMIGFVPIKIKSILKQQYILIDDDELIQMSWEMEAKRDEIDLFCFSSIEKFLNESNKFDRDSIIFIDSDLGEGIKGEVESERIHNLGFKELYLATGYSVDDIVLPSWIKSIVGKRADFNKYRG